jgi:hypothetical protein
LKIRGCDPCVRGAGVDYEGEFLRGNSYIGYVDAAADANEVFINVCIGVVLTALELSPRQNLVAVVGQVFRRWRALEIGIGMSFEFEDVISY